MRYRSVAAFAADARAWIESSPASSRVGSTKAQRSDDIKRLVLFFDRKIFPCLTLFS